MLPPPQQKITDYDSLQNAYHVYSLKLDIPNNELFHWNQTVE